jgi:hypothetical protein
LLVLEGRPELEDRALALACLFDETVGPNEEMESWAQRASAAQGYEGAWAFSNDELVVVYNDRDSLEVRHIRPFSVPEGLDPNATEPDPGIGWDGARERASDGWVDSYHLVYYPQVAGLWAFSSRLIISIDRDGNLRTIDVSETDLLEVDTVSLAVGGTAAASLFALEAESLDPEGEVSIDNPVVAYSFAPVADPPVPMTTEPRYVASVVALSLASPPKTVALSLVSPEDGLECLFP